MGTVLTELGIVVVERDPFVAEDISASLLHHFPFARCRVFRDLEQARPVLSPQGAPLLAVLSWPQAGPGLAPQEDLVALLGPAAILIDVSTDDLPTGPTTWQILAKPFAQEMLISAAIAALAGVTI